MQIQALFPLALGQVQLQPDPLDLAIWMQTVLELRGEAEGNPTPGCAWTGDLHGVWQVHQLPVFAPLVAELRRHAWAYLETLGFDRRRVALHVQRSWPVVSEADQVVGRHHHPNAHLSAVVYLNGDGSGSSGCLRLFPQRQVNELVPGLAVGHDGPLRPDAGPWNQPWVDVAPLAGLLVLFPACVDHAVTANASADGERRLSLVFDLALTAPRSDSAAAADPAAPAPCPSADSPPEYLAPHPSQWSPLEPPDPAPLGG